MMKELIKIIPTLTIKDWIGGLVFMLAVLFFLLLGGLTEDLNGLIISFLGR
jgi:hypothetical protein